MFIGRGTVYIFSIRNSFEWVVPRGYVRHIVLPCRKTLEERNEKAKEKSLNRGSSLDSMEAELGHLVTRLQSCEGNLDLWKAILRLLVSPIHHDVCNNHEKSWVELFQQLSEKDIPDPPVKFLASSSMLPYEDVIVEVSSHISFLKGAVDKAKKSANNKEKSLELSKAKAERRDMKMKRKAEQLIENKETGKDVELDENKKSLSTNKK